VTGQQGRSGVSLSARDAFLAVIVVLTIVIVPLGDTALHRSPLALPGSLVATIAFDFVSLVLVWQQFQRTGNPRYLVIGVGFVFAVVDQAFWMLSAPGLVAVSEVGVFGVANGPLFLGTWLSFFSVIVALGVARWPRGWDAPVARRRRLDKARAVLLVALVASLCWMAFALYIVPRAMRNSSVAEITAQGQTISITLAVFSLVVAATGRNREMVLRWAVAVPVTAVSTELLYLAGGELYSLGWYAAKVLTVINSGIIAVVLLAEQSASYRRAEARVTESEATLGRTLAAAGSPMALVRRTESGEWLVEFAGETARSHLGGSGLITPDAPLPAPVEFRPLLEDAVWRGRAEAAFEGEPEPIRCTAVAVDKGRVVVTWQDDATPRRVEANQQATRAIDEVTGLLNRDALLDVLGADLAAGQPLLVAYLDLDGFAVINDRYGYLMGDKILGDVARRLSTAVGPRGAVARLGSDDFAAVFLTGATVPDAEAVLRGALAEPIEILGERLLISATHGYAAADGEHEPERLLAQARTAMLNAREQGRGSSAVHDPNMRRIASGDTTREEFAAALEGDEFELHYQPILWQRSRGLWGYEALVSWEHPRLGRLPPGAYLPDAERWGLKAALGQWVMREACTASARSGRLITFNLGAADLSRPGLAGAIMSEVDRAGCDPAKLVVELTETGLLHAGPAVVATVLALRDEGIRVALDDFGSGFAAVGYLSWLPVDLVKVDREVIDPRVAEPPAALLHAVVDLAHSIGALALAEGIEDDATARRVKEAGFDLVQGFHYGRPRSADRILGSAERFPGSSVTILPDDRAQT
jgi:diguanylate cyclase (GGDEF)-like protein